MRSTSLFVGLVAACSVVVGLPSSSGGAAPLDAPVHQIGIGVDDDDMLEAFSDLRSHMVTAARERPRSAAPQPGPTLRQSEFCYFEEFGDTIGDAVFFDIDRYGLASDCTDWAFFAETAEAEAVEDLDGFAAVIDTDLRADTGCLGYEIWVSGIPDTDLGLIADVFARPSCDVDDLTRVAEAGFGRTDDGMLLALFVEEGLLPSASPFGYAVFTSSVFGDFDQAPNEGEEVRVAAPVPGAPTRLTAQPGARRVAVQWQAPATGGAVSYRATASPGGRSCTTNGTRCTISGLRNYTRYRISVVAINGLGQSAATRSRVVVPRPLRTCAGARVTVDLRAGDRPTRRADVILGTNRSERIAAGPGNDLICARGGRDLVLGQGGNDTILAGSGADRLVGGPGGDRLDGGSGRDSCRGGPGRDRIRNCP